MTFTASNGVELNKHGLGWGGPSASQEMLHEARIEFYRHLRDEELGRWRSKVDPAWTGKLDAETGWVQFRNDDGLREFSILLELRSLNGWAPELQTIGREYLEAHPEPKPWHDAKCGDSWYLEPFGIVYACVGDRNHSTGLWFTRANVYGKVEDVQLTDPLITDARKIWPEES